MDNPRTYPARHPGTVEREVQVFEAQRHQLEAMAAERGQQHALFIAPVEVMTSPSRGAFSATPWTEGRISVLAPADVVTLVAQPATVDDTPHPISVRWDVAARVCAATCWDDVPDLQPPRIITRRWPTPAELIVLDGLSLPDLPVP